LSEEVKKALNARGVSEAIFERITPGLVDYFDVMEKIQAANLDVVYYGGYSPEAGVLIRGLRNRGDDWQLVAGDGINSADFGLIAGKASEGTMFTSTLDLRNFPQAAALVARLRSEHYEPIGPTFLAYGAIQPGFPIWLGSTRRKDIGAWRSPGVKQFTLNPRFPLGS
jgi:branched-chain amino acid transport system substrate-binding protein